MSKTLTFEIPDEVYELLEQRARESGGSSEELALLWLTSCRAQSRRYPTPHEAEEAEASFRALFGSDHGLGLREGWIAPPPVALIDGECAPQAGGGANSANHA